jgi:hypothetical protein
LSEKIQAILKSFDELTAQEKLTVLKALSGSDIEQRGRFGGPAPGLVDLNKGYFGGPAPAKSSSANSCPECKRPY